MMSPDAWAVAGKSCLLRMGWLSLLTPTKQHKVKGQEARGPCLSMWSGHVSTRGASEECGSLFLLGKPALS